MESAIKILKAARELISVPERWTQNAYARDKHGEMVGPMHEDATCWCSLGAIIKCSPQTFQADPESEGYPATANARTVAEMMARIALQEVTQRAKQTRAFTVVNDRSTHADVVDLFDAAIEYETNRTNEDRSMLVNSFVAAAKAQGL